MSLRVCDRACSPPSRTSAAWAAASRRRPRRRDGSGLAPRRQRARRQPRRRGHARDRAPGTELLIGCDALVALHGARFAPMIEGVPLLQSRPVVVRSGARLRIGRATAGCFGYLAVAGGLQVDPVLGSRSTYLAGGFGGWRGKSLARDAELPFAPDAHALAAARFARVTARHRAVAVGRCETVRWLAPGVTLPDHDEPVIRTVEGIHAALFDESSRDLFLEERWRIAPDSNRMGFRLLGPGVALAHPPRSCRRRPASGPSRCRPPGSPSY